jgi:hypothetical protein
MLFPLSCYMHQLLIGPLPSHFLVTCINRTFLLHASITPCYMHQLLAGPPCLRTGALCWLCQLPLVTQSLSHGGLQCTASEILSFILVPLIEVLGMFD